MTTILVSICAGTLIACLLYILLVKKIERSKSGTEVLGQIRSEVNQMIVELNQTADRNIGLVEERIETLNRLLEHTDRQIRMLQRESDRYARSMDTYSSIKPGRVPVSPSPRPVEKPKPKTDKPKTGKREQIIELYNQGISTELIASRVDSTVAEVELIISINEEKEE